jgi:pimeloyl-ACP methyl ester carboxylesterase
VVAPEVLFARTGDLSIAYQVLGRQGPDVVLVPGFVSHLDLAWEEPFFARFLRGLGSFSRLIWFDRRGTGLSDPVPDGLSLNDLMQDLRTVMRAAGCERATLVGVAVGAAICTAYALAHPADVQSLVCGVPTRACSGRSTTRQDGARSSSPRCSPVLTGSGRAGRVSG